MQSGRSHACPCSIKRNVGPLDADTSAQPDFQRHAGIHFYSPGPATHKVPLPAAESNTPESPDILVGRPARLQILRRKNNCTCQLRELSLHRDARTLCTIDAVPLYPCNVTTPQHRCESQREASIAVRTLQPNAPTGSGEHTFPTALADSGAFGSHFATVCDDGCSSFGGDHRPCWIKRSRHVVSIAWVLCFPPSVTGTSIRPNERTCLSTASISSWFMPFWET